MIDLNELPLAALWDELVDDAALRTLLELARAEDLGDGDVTSELAIAPERIAQARLRPRRDGVIAGLRTIGPVVEAFGADLEVTLAVDDGAPVIRGETVATLSGSLRDVLAVERTMLNLVGHLSGVATLTRSCVDAVRGTSVQVCDTRKTTPGLRTLEKYAVRCGGGTMHRIGLFDAVLLKDNHVAGLEPSALAETVAVVAEAARGRVRFVEVEVDTLEQLSAILSLPVGTVDIVLLDNMTRDRLAEAVRMRNDCGPLPKLEASGGIAVADVRSVAATGVDRIALGALTHSVCVLDVGLDVDIDGDIDGELDRAVDGKPDGQWEGRPT